MVSVKATPAAAVPAFGLVSVIVKFELVPLVATGFGENDFVTTNGCVVVNVADAVVPTSATGPVAAGADVVLLLVLVAVTLCVIVQVPPGTMVPAVNPTELPPLAPPVSVALPTPLQTTPPAALFSNVPV